MTTLPRDLNDAVDAWLAIDPDDATHATLGTLRDQAAAGDAEALDELTDAFAGRLTFGTAGLRAALGPGPNRMNRVVVSQAAAGFARWLQSQGHTSGTVLVGYDARHNSDVFARDTAEIMAAAGFTALLTERPTPTPVVAFGIRHLGCVAAVVVTASHNPPADNGYKVYLGDGSQIVPPADAEIAAAIAEVAAGDFAAIPRSNDYQLIGAELTDAYVARAASLLGDRDPRDLVWVYTAMHGVGARIVEQVVDATGLPSPIIVAEQHDPDPEFPTVSFPNPEEPGAMDRALALAAEHDADVVIANDPDADRCAAAARIDGEWRKLTGDELGWLLADDAIRRGHPGRFACSIVSSTLLRTMAEQNGREFVPTLTGFKWIGRVPDLAFGYEEAIGYCCDSAFVPDKDGITAATVLLRLVAELKAEGQTLSDRLDEIALAYGACVTSQLSVRVDDLSIIANAMARVRANPPTELAGHPVTVLDRNSPVDELPPTDAVEFTGESVHVVVRPSGTEPKLKCYLEAKAAPGRTDLAAARAEVAATVEALRGDMARVLGL